ncbi:MAG TPA: HEAT repeat domain-containing protein [Leptolyngbyaceae cyanobacterium]
MNSSDNLAKQQRQFLEEMAKRYNFTGDTRTVFLFRFDPANDSKDNTRLAEAKTDQIKWNREPEDKRQKLQDELANICQVLEQHGYPIEKPKRGRQPKGKSPWEQASKWLWEKEFPKCQPRQILDVLSEEEQKEAVCRFLQNIEDKFKNVYLLHRQEQPIVLKDQYIPIQVTLERKYTHAVETTWGYAESEAELKRAYALKGLEESQPSQVDWKEAKQQHQRIMVLADPGMGKSTLLRMEAGLTAQEERQSLANNVKNIEDVTFPLFLRLSELAEATNEVTAKLIEAIPRLIEAKYDKTFAEIKSLLVEKLRKGQCILLLDALDEVPNDKEQQQRKRLSEKLNDFLHNYPCRIISTSRIVGYGGAFVQGTKQVEIVPFSQKQTEDYIDKWFDKAAGYLNNDAVSASSLIQELRNKPQIRGLAQNPLLLSLICSLYQEKGLTLPARRGQVYEQAVRYMLGKWSKKRNPELNDAWIDAKTELLEELAYQFSCDGKDIFTERELRHKIDKYLRSENASSDFRDKNASCLITELSKQDGILQKLHEDGKQYLFLHRTFQEYLTACYLNQSNDSIAKAKEHFWEYEWHETLSLLAGLRENPVPLLQAIADEKDDIFSTLLLLAGRCIAECQENSHPLIAEIINNIYQFWCCYPYLGFIESVVVAIGQTHSQMFEKLQKSLESEGFRQSAVKTLGKVGNLAVVEALITALSDKDILVRSYAAEALGKIGSPEAVEALITALRDEYLDVDVRRSVAEALGKIGNPEAVETLITALNQEKEPIRSSAAKALGEIATPRVVKALITALSDEDSWVRSYAAEALGKIGSSEAVEALITAFGDENENEFVRRYAAEALGRIASLEAVSVLTAALSNDDWDVRVSAAVALSRMGTPQIASLISALSQKDRAVRLKAVAALSEIGTHQAVDALITVLSDEEDGNVRLNTAVALSKMGTPQAVEVLIQTLDDGFGFYRMIAVEALGEIGNPQALEVLIQALIHGDGIVYEMALGALGEIGTSETLAQLIQLPEIDIYDPWIFPSARTLAIRFRKERLPFIPIYPELVAHQQ